MSVDDFKDAVKKAAEEFKSIDKKESICVISHLDSDGISAASIILKMLHYEQRKYVLSIVSQLDREILEQISKEPYNVFIFSDMGSGNIDDIKKLFEGKKVVILDHHKPKEASNGIVHVNPHLFGIEGSEEISGAGVSYFFCKEVDDKIKKMSYIALVGAIGDCQEENGFSELNKEILNDAMLEGKIRVEKGIKSLRYQNRAMHKMIENGYELKIPGVTGNEKGSMEFLQGLGIYNNEWKKMSELVEEEVMKLAEAIANKREKGERVEEIMWNNYVLVGKKEEPVGLREFSTLLNACGRMGKASIGVGMCIGDKGMGEKSVSCLHNYKKEIMKALDWFNNNRKNGNVIEKEGYLIINTQDKILGTIVGTMCSMISRSKSVGEGTIIMAMAHLIDGKTKISLRIAGRKEGIDLREIMKEIIEKANFGEYGGHKNAAGALVPTENEERFLEIAKDVLEKKSLEEEIC